MSFTTHYFGHFIAIPKNNDDGLMERIRSDSRIQEIEAELIAKNSEIDFTEPFEEDKVIIVLGRRAGEEVYCPDSVCRPVIDVDSLGIDTQVASLIEWLQTHSLSFVHEKGLCIQSFQ